ncbi:hypothetical protein N6B72_06900 [Chryseobacterium soli]|uniref:Uncharacterized protein n=1 Tax=Chryseobacterium soli TaxID=445961 RepID=A0A086ACA7_9FLAO|nr:hypothetical protein [Chryseobacterium soli]KFF14321.1 hypothetical protein IW15_02435 [Chryseobacterium soli]MDV7696641.1 hypothetical protein [Chryseobacterium soli]
MKKILFLLCPVIFFAQKIETINLSKSINDRRSTVKSFDVIDQRADKEIGTVMQNKEKVSIVFPNDAVTDIKTWFNKSNKERGNDDMVLMLEKLNVSEEQGEKYSEGKINFKASTFLKRNDGYHFLYRKDTVVTISSRVTAYLSKSLARSIAEGFTDLVRNSQKFLAWEQAIPENELGNYDSLMKNNMALFINKELKDGIYEDFYDFFTQNPQPGFTLEKNSKGEINRAVNGKKKITLYHLYAYVSEGKAYKNTPIGVSEIFKNENGFYIISNRGSLFPVKMNVAYGSFGLVGAALGAIETTSKNNREQKKDKTEVYLDPFTGHYQFSE